jgi:signal transduction histidine kinase
MVKMVERLLLYTQAKFGGGLALDKELADLEQISRDAIGDVKSLRPGAEIQFKAEGDCSGTWDRVRLTEVAANLVENAVKHGQPGRPIDVLVRAQGDHVALQVHNFGPPIPAELMPVLFEPFRRAGKQSGPGGGSFGLGLYISREIVAAHGGTLEVSSSAEDGTTFIVHLPRAAAGHTFEG